VIEPPIHFMVAFWGERYRRYFLECAWASVNPQMRARDRWLIACPPDDWDYLRRHGLTVNMIWEPIPAADTRPRTRAVPVHQEMALRKLMERAYAMRVYAGLMSPDIIFSDNLVTSLVAAIKRGDNMVLILSTRQDENGVLTEIGKNRCLSAREVARLNIKHLHREMWPFEQGNPLCPLVPPIRYWRHPDGLILHAHVAMPILMDFGWLAAKRGRIDTDCLRNEALENIFMQRNFTGSQVHLITDSDEVGCISLSPDYGSAWTRKRFLNSPFMERLGLRVGYFVWTNSGLPGIFAKPIWWHAGDAKVPQVFAAATSAFCAQEAEQNPLQWCVSAAIYLLRYRFYFWLARRPWLKAISRKLRPERV
jgi:hypothetical protein